MYHVEGEANDRGKMKAEWLAFVSFQLFSLCSSDGIMPDCMRYSTREPGG